METISSTYTKMEQEISLYIVLFSDCNIQNTDEFFQIVNVYQKGCYLKNVLTSSPPQAAAIACAVSKALFKSEEYIAEILRSFDSLSATFVENYGVRATYVID